MRTVSATEAKQGLAGVIEAVRKEPVIIRRQNRDVADLLDLDPFHGIRILRPADFLQLPDQ